MNPRPQAVRPGGKCGESAFPDVARESVLTVEGLGTAPLPSDSSKTKRTKVTIARTMHTLPASTPPVG